MSSSWVKEDPGTAVSKKVCVEFASLAVSQDVGVKSPKALAMSPREFNRGRYQKGCSNLMSFKTPSKPSSVYRKAGNLCRFVGKWSSDKKLEPPALQMKQNLISPFLKSHPLDTGPGRLTRPLAKQKMKAGPKPSMSPAILSFLNGHREP